MRGFWLLAMVAVAAAVQFQPTHRLSPSVLRPQREALGLAQIAEDPKPAEPAPPKAEAGTDADKPVTAVATNVDTKPADKPADTSSNTGDKPATTDTAGAAAPAAPVAGDKPAGENTAAKPGETKPADTAAPAPDAGKAEPEKQEAKSETAEKTGADAKKEPPLVDLTKEEDDKDKEDTANKDKDSTDGEAEAGSDNPMFAPDPEDTGGDDNADDATKDATTGAAAADAPKAEDEETGIGSETEQPDAEPAAPQAEEEAEPTDDANLKSVDKPNLEAEEQEEKQKEATDEAAESDESNGEEEAPAEPASNEDDKPFVPPENLSLKPAPDATTTKKAPDEFDKRLDVLQDLVDRLEDKFLAQYGKNIRPRPRNTKLDAVYASKIDQLEQRILDLGNRLRPNSKRISPRAGGGTTLDDKRLDTLTQRVAEIDQALANSPSSIAPVSVEPGTPNLDANGNGQTRTLYSNNNFPRRGRFNHLPKYQPPAPPASTEPETVDSLKMNDPNAPENQPRDVPDWVSQRNWREPIMKFKQRAGRKAGRP